MKKNICLLFTGKIKLENTKELVSLLTGSENEYYITLTTWVNEYTNDFELLFPNSFINYIDLPDQKNIDKFISGHRYESTRPLSNYYHQLYIRSKAVETLKKINIDFDVIILLRTDTKIWKNISDLYDDVKKDDNTVYTAIGPNWDIYGGRSSNDLLYGEGACPDVIFFSNMPTMCKILTNQILISTETQQVKGVYHPETCQLNCFKLLGLKIERMYFDAFVYESKYEAPGYASLPTGYNIIK